MPNIVGYQTYTTVMGDTFDGLALTFYSNEKMASVIMAANPDHCSTLVFDAGVELFIPIVENATQPETLPPWRREL